MNGQPVESKMMLDESGHAFFVRLKQNSMDTEGEGTCNFSGNRSKLVKQPESQTEEKERDESAASLVVESKGDGKATDIVGPEEEEESPVLVQERGHHTSPPVNIRVSCIRGTGLSVPMRVGSACTCTMCEWIVYTVAVYARDDWAELHHCQTQLT